jgi:hypothetical protein
MGKVDPKLPVVRVRYGAAEYSPRVDNFLHRSSFSFETLIGSQEFCLGFAERTEQTPDRTIVVFLAETLKDVVFPDLI